MKVDDWVTSGLRRGELVSCQRKGEAFWVALSGWAKTGQKLVHLKNSHNTKSKAEEVGKKRIIGKGPFLSIAH